MKNSHRKNAIISLIFTVVFIIVGIVVYSSGYIILLFRFIPLSAPVFAILAILLLAYSIWQFISAKKEDEVQVQALEAQSTAASLQGQLTAPTTVTLTRQGKAIGAIYKLEVALNGQAIGKIKNKETITFVATVPENDLLVVYPPTGNSNSLHFTAAPGGTINITTYVNAQAAIVLEMQA
jgi:hypothetical protein